MVCIWNDKTIYYNIYYIKRLSWSVVQEDENENIVDGNNKRSENVESTIETAKFTR